MHFPLPALVLAALSALPLVTWAAFKPIRVLAPHLAGVQCTEASICIDDFTKLDQALVLRDESVNFVEVRIGKVRQIPRFIFCSSAECAKSFGFTSNAAYHVGTFGIVIGPRGWQSHIARHELIHHLQMENLGSLHALLHTPTWFIEGMAYSLSEDPRKPLPQPLEGWRAEFERWYPSLVSQDFWATARALR
jgi:hypothetical protein